MARIPLIVGNWKMYKTGQEAREFVQILASELSRTDRRVFLSVPFTALESAAQAASGMGISIGAQNMHDYEEGAFTGEVSARMLKAAGAQFVILGHSERRHYFCETNAFINRKLLRACSEKITPILCIGEHLKEREQNVTEHVLSVQLEECLQGVRVQDLQDVIIAYEPLWAIGTGKSASAHMAQETMAFIRLFIAQAYGKKAADELCLLYGGSVKQENIADLMNEADIDGVLVGGASLDPSVFARIINY